MHNSVSYWLKIAYRQNEPEIARIAQDASPARALVASIRRLRRRWERQFDQLSQDLAAWFAQEQAKRSDTALRNALRKGGFTVRFKMTKPMNDAYQAVIAENVGLIKSIPAQYLSQVEGMVMRSVQVGRDLGTLAGDLESQFGVSKRRAALISRDQSNKATAVLTRVRHLELGIVQAQWVHSRAGKVPRPTHVAASRDKVLYLVSDGWYDPAIGRRIWPGTEINCFPGSVLVQFADHVEKAYRNWYRGYLTEIITDDGKSFCCTPNHPILSSKGWIAANLLNEGDRLFQVSEEGIEPGSLKHDVDGDVPLFSDVFQAAAQARGSRLKIALGANFHGDIINTDVEIIDAKRPLRFGRQTFFNESTQKLNFSMTDYAASAVGSEDERFGAIERASTGSVSLSNKSLPTLDAFTTHTDDTGGTPASRVAASQHYVMGDGAAVMAPLSGEGEDTFPRLMLPTKIGMVVSIRRKFFAGHVFNLQTASGWYAAGGIIAHNCRCVARPIMPFASTEARTTEKEAA